MYLHKCKLKNLMKMYQEKWENAYLTVEMQEFTGHTSGGPFTPANIGFFTHLTLCYISKILENFLGLP